MLLLLHTWPSNPSHVTGAWTSCSPSPCHLPKFPARPPSAPTHAKHTASTLQHVPWADIAWQPCVPTTSRGAQGEPIPPQTSLLSQPHAGPQMSVTHSSQCCRWEEASPSVCNTSGLLVLMRDCTTLITCDAQGDSRTHLGSLTLLADWAHCAVATGFLTQQYVVSKPPETH